MLLLKNLQGHHTINAILTKKMCILWKISKPHEECKDLSLPIQSLQKLDLSKNSKTRKHRKFLAKIF